MAIMAVLAWFHLRRLTYWIRTKPMPLLATAPNDRCSGKTALPQRSRSVTLFPLHSVRAVAVRRRAPNQAAEQQVSQEPPPYALEAQRSRGIRPCCADSPPRMNGERRPPTRCQPNVSWEVMQQKMPQWASMIRCISGKDEKLRRFESVKE